MTVEKCETCGDPATQWDYDQTMYFCDRHVQQADFTIPLEDKCDGTCGFTHPHRRGEVAT